MTFGATCSPFAAQEVRNKNAIKYKDEFPDAKKAIVESHYMDDCIDSVHTVDEAIKLRQDITEVHRRGGFKICNWMSNSHEVLESIPEELKKIGKKEFTEEQERILGINWNSKTDEFVFKLKFNKVSPEILNGTKTPTKRELLGLVMSVYDPLGFVGHFVVRAKILLQDIWRSKLNWD